MATPHLPFDVPPYRLSGAVYGALLNDPAQLLALGDAVHQPPYRAPPQAPVLEVKPRHTLSGDGDDVFVPVGAGEIEIGASLGIVVGTVACRVSMAQALDVVAGYVIAGDLGLPLGSHYRPSVRLKARDGFCPLGPRVVPAAEVPNPDALVFEVSVADEVVQRGTTAGRIRGVARLIAEVTEFMTLLPGDVLLLGRPGGVPLARAGQSVAIAFAGLGRLHVRLVAEAPVAGQRA